MKKCTVLLSTCDSYEDTWNPFFKLMNKYWEDCPYDVFINTESKNYIPNFNTKLNIVSLHPINKKLQWGGRMLEV